jgi:hypothetical protein
MKIVPVGGRIKSASVGLDHIFDPGDGVDEEITRLRREPPDYLRKAFFPRIGKDMAQAIRGVGFFRPSLKTDQGMAGNFLPFHVHPEVQQTDLNRHYVEYEEGCAIPEAWHPEVNGYTAELQAAFSKLDLRTTFGILEKLGKRTADKGRLPFFLIRPALPDSPIVFGADVVAKVASETERLVDKCAELGRELELKITGKAHLENILYVQPDVFVLSDGTIAVEKLNCPDVCFFLARVLQEHSQVLPQVQDIVRRLRDHVAAKILDAVGTDVTIVTRDEVIMQQQDVLEILEIQELENELRRGGATVQTVPVSQVGSLECGSRLLLLNVDYSSTATAGLLRRHSSGELACFPNPYFQMACSYASGLKESTLAPEDKHRDRFLAWTRSQPSGEQGRADVLRQIDAALVRDGIEEDIIHAVLATETVPVYRRSLHAWRQFEARLQRPENAGKKVRFRGIPATPKNLMLTSDTGPRLHGFRFMCVA